jgi:hypothetical protein
MRRASANARARAAPRIAAWLRSHFSYADVSESTLRATNAALRISGLFAQQRAAIEQELTTRAWCAWVEARLQSAYRCVWCSRGGVS